MKAGFVGRGFIIQFYGFSPKFDLPGSESIDAFPLLLEIHLHGENRPSNRAFEALRESDICCYSSVSGTALMRTSVVLACHSRRTFKEFWSIHAHLLSDAFRESLTMGPAPP